MRTTSGDEMETATMRWSVRTIGAWTLAVGLSVSALACGNKSSGNLDHGARCVAGLEKSEKEWTAIASTSDKDGRAKEAADAAGTAAASVRVWREKPDNAEAKQRAMDDARKARDAAEKAQALGVGGVKGTGALTTSAGAGAACGLAFKQ